MAEDAEPLAAFVRGPWDGGEVALAELPEWARGGDRGLVMTVTGRVAYVYQPLYRDAAGRLVFLCSQWLLMPRRKGGNGEARDG